MTAVAEAPDKTSLWHPPAVAKREAAASRLIAAGLKGLVEAEPYIKRLASMQSDRQPMEPIWREVRKFLMPFAGRYLDGETEELSENFLLDLSSIRDGSPIKMALTAADGLQSGLSGQATQWFSYYVGNYQDFKESVSNDVKLWVRNAQECVRDILGASNFYEEIHQVYLEAICFGTAAMLILSDPITTARYYAATVGAYWLAQDARREIDSMYLRSTCRASDLVRIYGRENCPQAVIEAIKPGGSPDRLFHVMQCIQPWNYFGNSGRHPEYRFEEVRYVEGCRPDEKVLYRKGYRSKPFVVVRWGAAGGRLYANNCPGFLALPDVKQLQAETRDYNMGTQWASNPAWGVNSAQAKMIKGIRPGGIYEIAGGDPRAAALQALVPPIFNFSESNNSRSRLLERISSHLYNREILLIQSRGGQSITATEVNELKQEKNAVLGPITVRMGTNALIPTLDRTFDLANNEWHRLPPAPPEISGQKLQPYFTSDLAKAQRQADIIMASQVVQQALEIANLYPQIRHTLDFDAILRLYEKTDALPAECFNSPDKVEALIAADAQAAQAQAQQMQQAQNVDLAQKLGNTSTAPDTALGMLAGGEAPA